MSEREELINLIWGHGVVSEMVAEELADAVIGWQAAHEHGGEVVAWMGTHPEDVPGFFESLEDARKQFGFAECCIRPLYTHPAPRPSDGWAGTPEQEIETLRKMVERRDVEIERLRGRVESLQEAKND